jgi:hypothetical protein
MCVFPVLRTTKDSRVIFWCEGCQEPHAVPVNEGRWTWNGDLNFPTMHPSIEVTGGHYAQGGTGCWCNFEARFGEPAPFKCNRCHSFVENGMIKYLPDCSHSLAGQTVPLKDINHWRDDFGFCN